MLLLSGSACSWTRFDELLDNSPVQILKAPADLNAIGRSLAFMRAKSSTLAFATADSGYAIYEFNEQNLASPDATRDGICVSQQDCWLANSVASITRIIDSKATSCVAFGVEANKSTPTLTLYCSDNVLRSLPLMDPASGDFVALTSDSSPPDFNLASGPRLAPDMLLFASPTFGAAWFYSVGSDDPIAITKPETASASFGATLAVVGTDSNRYLAVGDPSAATLHVFMTDGAGPPSASMCIVGPKRFTNALAAGHFTDANSNDLAIASSSEVMVLAALENLPFSSEPSPSCVPLDEITATRRISCQKMNAGNPCGGLLLGVSVTASDLDGNGRDELLIGVPSASARGNDAAGKILVTSFAKESPALIEELSPSSAESGDRFGSSVLGVPLSRPEVVLAGAPGGNKLAAMFCTTLLAKGEGGDRCQ